MVTTALVPIPVVQFLTNSGAILAGGKLFTYAAGTTTKQNTYTDATGVTANANPVVLDANGRANVWLDVTKAYKLVLSPSTDTDPPVNAIWTVDSIPGSALSIASLKPTTQSTNYTTTVADHLIPIEVTGATTISLGDAATMGSGYQPIIVNYGILVVTVAVITASNTLNGSANGTVKLLPGQAMTFAVNNAKNGYEILHDTNRAPIILTGAAGTNTITCACDSVTTAWAAGQLFILIPAVTNTGATTVNPTPVGGTALGAKNVFAGGAACNGNELVATVPTLLEYDGTQLNIVGLTGSRGTVVLTLTGCTTSPTVTAIYSITNNVVTLFIPSVTATSNTTACTLTGLAGAITPATNHLSFFAVTQDNGSTGASALDIQSNSIVQLYLQGSATSTTFTNSGTKGLAKSVTVTYNLN